MFDRDRSSYDQFAWFYNKHWAGAWLLRITPLLEQLMLGNLPSGAAILDLCCGTGQLAAILSDRGFKVVGLDISEEMLKFARVNAPKTTFHCADARPFPCTTPSMLPFPRTTVSITSRRSMNSEGCLWMSRAC